MKNVIGFMKDDETLTITIPVALLKFAAENNPEIPMLVKDEQEFAKKVLFKLEHNLGDLETGLSGFQTLLDKAIVDVLESGEDCIEIVEADWQK